MSWSSCLCYHHVILVLKQFREKSLIKKTVHPYCGNPALEHLKPDAVSSSGGAAGVQHEGLKIAWLVLSDKNIMYSKHQPLMMVPNFYMFHHYMDIRNKDA